MKNLTKDAVKKTAVKLMNDNGETTNLDIKNELRTEGYNAKQKAVSDFMIELASEENWEHTNNGNHRTYTIGDDSDSSNRSAVVATLQKTTTATKTNKITNAIKVAGKSITTKTKGNAKDWKAYTPNNSSVLYFDQAFSRDQVRGAFAKITGVAFNDSRACRI